MTPRPALLAAALTGLLLSGCSGTGEDAALPAPADAPAATASGGSPASPTGTDTGSAGTRSPTIPPPSARPPAATRPSASTRPPVAPGRALLFPRTGGDGDSWKDRAGVEYRLGLVNAPELNECFGSKASSRRKALTRAGFTAQAYTTDDYGRRVSVVTLADGRELNVLLAREGYVDDRYLEQFRDENQALATRLDAAFAAARRERAGLWGACSGRSTAPQGIVTPAAPAQPVAPAPRGDCDAAYPGVCLPSPAPDLDCGDISERRFQVRPPDPHRFDSDGDGLGCETG